MFKHEPELIILSLPLTFLLFAKQDRHRQRDINNITVTRCTHDDRMDARLQLCNVSLSLRLSPFLYTTLAHIQHLTYSQTTTISCLFHSGTN